MAEYSLLVVTSSKLPWIPQFSKITTDHLTIALPNDAEVVVSPHNIPAHLEYTAVPVQETNWQIKGELVTGMSPLNLMKPLL